MLELDEILKIETILKSTNLAEDLDEDDLNEIGAYIVSGYETDIDSRQEWEDKIGEWTNLALQVAEKKTFPWPNAANVKYPLVTVASMQFNARAYPALISGTNPVRGRVIGKDVDGSKTERSIRVAKHMSYQLIEQMDDWEEQMDKLLFALPIVGCLFKKTYYSTTLGRNVSEVVYPKELVVNYWAKTLEDAQRITHVLEYSDNALKEKISGGLFKDQDYQKEPSESVEGNDTDKALGQEKPEVEDDTSPFIFLEQCCFLDLDGDGYKEPYIVTVDKATKKVARIVARFENKNITYAEDGKTILRIDPFQFYTKFSFVPSPDGGFYDIGFGVVLGPINETINTLINQLLDAGTLSNLQSGFISKGIRIRGGNMSFTPGEWKSVNSVGADIKQGLLPLPVREPSQVLFSLLGMMVTAGEKLSSVSEIMTGEIPGQNVKATVAMTAVEQGMKIFNAIYKRIHRSLSKEYKKLFKLNSMYLNEKEYFVILDVGNERGEQIGIKDYNLEDVDVVPSSDPNVATEQQRLQKLEVLTHLLQMGTINPQEYTKRFLEATEQPNIEALMQMPDRGPPPELEFEMKQHQDKMMLEWKKVEIEATTGIAQAIKYIADAEAAEPGDNQVEQYAQMLNVVKTAKEAQEKLRQQQEAHQQQMAQKEQMHQQAMAHKQQLNNQALNSGGVNNGSGNQ